MSEPICEGGSWGPGKIVRYPCEMKAKWFVEMEGRPPVQVCGRHIRSYRDEISLGWRGTITALAKVQHK